MMYHLLSFFVRFLSYIPFGILYFLSDCMFYVVYYLIRYRRHIVRKNLTESFPEKSEQEIKKIEKQFYHFFTDNVLESCKLTTISKEEMRRRMRFVNMEDVNAVLRDGKSVSLYLGHYANWEWISSIPLHMEKGVVGAQIYHKLRNEKMDRLILRNRERMGAVCVEMRKTARYINELVKDNKISLTGYIADQSPKKREAHHFINFLNHTVPVLVGTEKITKHYGFDAWFISIERIKRGNYEVKFVRMHENPKSLPDFELTSIYFQMLEQEIRKHPELYLWTHRRFKYAMKLDV